MADRIQTRRDFHENWYNTNQIIADGERIVVRMANGEENFKTGDGITRYRNLEFERPDIYLNDIKQSPVDGKINLIVSGGGTGDAHIILDENGGVVPQRRYLQHLNAQTIDDPTNNTTKIISQGGGESTNKSPYIGANGNWFEWRLNAFIDTGVRAEGPQGAQGEIGPTGPQGIQGIQGPIGLQGIQGVDGPQGIQGVQGLQGSQGERGEAGVSGINYRGDFQLGETYNYRDAVRATDGNAYYAMENGLIDEPPSDGWALFVMKGADGPQGIQGIQGEIGPTGPQGIQGIQGSTGEQGIQGPMGITGERGEQGEQGERGEDGLDGLNATINGLNVLNIVDGENTTVVIEGNTLKINSSGGGGSGAVNSVNGKQGDVVLDSSGIKHDDETTIADRINQLQDDKVDKIAGKSLISDNEIARLSAIENFDNTQNETRLTNIKSDLDEHKEKTDIHILDASADGKLRGRIDNAWGEIPAHSVDLMFFGIENGNPVANHTSPIEPQTILPITHIPTNPGVWHDIVIFTIGEDLHGTELEFIPGNSFTAKFWVRSDMLRDKAQFRLTAIDTNTDVSLAVGTVEIDLGQTGELQPILITGLYETPAVVPAEDINMVLQVLSPLFGIQIGMFSIPPNEISYISRLISGGAIPAPDLERITALEKLSGDTPLETDAKTLTAAINEVNAKSGGGGSNMIWRPNVSEQGVISFERSSIIIPPDSQNIRGKDAEIKTFTAVLSTEWGLSLPYTQFVQVEGITLDMSPIIDITLTDNIASSKLILEAWSLVGRIRTVNNGIIATCFGDSPQVEIPIQIKVVF